MSSSFLSKAKSVQERLAEAMLTESHFTSEPELSDTTTEEEEEATDKRHEESNNGTRFNNFL